MKIGIPYLNNNEEILRGGKKMKWMKLLVAGALCMGLLAGCGGQEEGVSEADSNIEYTALEDIDFENEDFTWDDVHLKKSDVEEFLKNMEDENAEEFIISSARISGKDQIEVTMNTDMTIEEIEESLEVALTVGMMVFIGDTIIRQVYIHSDFGNQPEIVFLNNNGGFIASNNDFIEIETDEAEFEGN